MADEQRITKFEMDYSIPLTNATENENHPTERANTDDVVLEKFEDMFLDLGLHEMLTCFVAVLSQIAYGWQKMSYFLFQTPYEYECIEEAVVPCDPNCEKIIFPAAGNKTNIITEWTLVCDNEYKLVLPETCFLIASMVAFLIFGHVSDQHGRRNCIICSCLIVLIAGCLAAITPWFWLYCFAQVFLGFGIGGWNLCCFVFMVEYVAEKHREFMVVLIQIALVTGLSSLPILVKLVYKWRTLQFILSGIGLICVVYIWMLPESPCWLLLTGRIEECATVLQTPSRNNNIPRERLEKIIRNTYTDLRAGNYPQMSSFADLFKTKEMRKKTLIVTIVWFTVAFCSAITLEIRNIENHLFVLYRGCAMIIGTLLGFPIVKFLSRRTVQQSMFALFTISLFAIAPVVYFGASFVYDMVIDVIFIILLSILSLNILLIATESYPTYLRNTGMGLGFCLSYLGLFALQFWQQQSSFNESTKLVLMVSLSCLSMILMLYIPETKGQNFPHIIEHNENVSEHSLSQKNQVT